MNPEAGERFRREDKDMIWRDHYRIANRQSI